MISLQLENNNKKYLEILIDETGCQDLIDKISTLFSSKTVLLDTFTPHSFIKDGYIDIRNLSLVSIAGNTIADTDYNIECFFRNSNVIEICLTNNGVKELKNILEYVHSEKDHFHLFGGFDLYTGDNDVVSQEYINAITVYIL